MARAHVQTLSGRTDCVIVRTHYFDGWICSAERPQVVILGAALDMRAFRLPGFAGAVVFEVDKAKVLAAKFGMFWISLSTPRLVARRVRRVSAGAGEDWTRTLEATGFDVRKPTSWLAESCLPMMSDDAAAMLLDRIRELSAPGSRLAFCAKTRLGRCPTVRSVMPEPEDMLRVHGYFLDNVDAVGGPKARFGRCARRDW